MLRVTRCPSTRINPASRRTIAAALRVDSRQFDNHISAEPANGLRDRRRKMQMTDIRFDGRVAAITGAANGLGRAYALELAGRGAKIVVNDLGSMVSGNDADDDVAHSVVAEIAAAGGEAVAHFGDVGSVDDMQGLVDLAISTWGRIDILVANAGAPGGPTSDVLFGSSESWERSLRVNLLGVVNPLRAAWPHFTEQNYGRVVLTSSSSMMGTPGVSPYQAAKAGVVGLTKVIANTYPDVDIKVNALMPTAWTRMTGMIAGGAYRDWLEDYFQPELVASFVSVLCHESLDVKGEAFTVGGGRAARVLFQLTDGWWEKSPTAESFAEHFDVVMSGNNPIFATSGQGDLSRYVDWLGDPGVFPEERVERARAGRARG